METHGPCASPAPSVFCPGTPGPTMPIRPQSAITMRTAMRSLATKLALCIVTLPLAAAPAALADTYGKMVTDAVAFLGEQQAGDGSFSGQFGSGVTSLATTGLLKHGRPPQDPVVSRALAYLVSQAKEDGGLYLEGTRYRNYETCLAIMCLSEAKRRLARQGAADAARYDDLLAGAERFVRKLQWDRGEGHGPESMNYGGAGYGSKGRPDLSNTSFLIEALKETGAGEDDPAIRAALVFVSRTQNLETEYNTSPFAAAVGDGGFYYTPAAGGQSQAGSTSDGGLRSYGSMTYAGLKSMLYAGVGPDDPRVKAAYGWVRRNYTLEVNPGMGSAGYYYYLHTFAKTLDAVGGGTLTDGAGAPHDWRRELVAKLAELQADDGSWVNPNKRWLEGDRNLVAGYALLALAYCRPDAAE